jgi:hypothetical protein
LKESRHLLEEGGDLAAQKASLTTARFIVTGVDAEKRPLKSVAPKAESN